MKTNLVSYLLTGVAFFGLDFVWLSIMGGAFYRPMLGSMVLDKFNLAPALTFYLIYIVGIVAFAVLPGIAAGSALTALGYGLLFGFCAYATYDLTNMATLKNWPLALTLVDLGWGTLVTGLSALIGCKLTSLLIH